MNADPQQEYETRLAALRAVERRLERRIDLLANLRLAAGLTLFATAVFVFAPHVISPAWLLAPLAALAGLVVHHGRVRRRAERASRAARWYQAGLDRMGGKWTSGGVTGEQFRDTAHPYAEDLDLFGHASLFALLCAARTAAGETTLARWLKEPAGRAEALARQEALREMALDLREDMALAGEEIRAGLHEAQLDGWAKSPPVRFFAGARVVLAALCAASVITLALFFAGWATLRPFLAVFVVLTIVQGLARRAYQEVAHGVDLAARDLELLARLIERIERERFQSAKLVELHGQLSSGEEPASVCVRRLKRLVDLLDSTGNSFFAPVAFVLLWGPQMAMAVERWRRAHGQDVTRWIAALGQIEAILSLAGYAFENPAAVLPELVEVGPLVEAEGLTHPLIPAERAVANDVRLEAGHGFWMVSGSNMSGKSTLLRAVGLGAVMAWAGAPVRARRLRISQLAVGASIRNVDSLEDGRSRFFAEITRLRQITTLTEGPRPVLFLLDELLSGTNSHDRKIGAEAILKGLVERGAVGLATTHDLALTRIAGEMDGKALNVHFEDTFEGGQIHFDYVLRPGVVERSNALALMRSIGFEL